MVIIRFVRRVVRNNVFFKRRNLKGTSISISDHLTRSNFRLFEQAKAAFGYENTWTSMSKIFINCGGKRYEIKSSHDINNILNFTASFNNQYDSVSQSPPKSNLINHQPDTIELVNEEESTAGKDLSNAVVDTSPPAALQESNASLPMVNKDSNTKNTANRNSTRTQSSNNNNSFRVKNGTGRGTHRSSQLISKKPDLRYNK